MDEERFTRAVVELVAKRAANICSDPDCRALTSGPADDPVKSTSVGEAAHIYGARPKSARYDQTMSDVERGAITNAIWLCCNCHKKVDDDSSHFPAGLLFEWKRSHEQEIAERLGKPGALARQRYAVRHLAELGPLSYHAEQIIIEKPDHWEYRLTAELLRSKVGPVLLRWNDLKAGLYSRAAVRVSKSEMMPWLQDRTHEMLPTMRPVANILNGGIQAAWGLPGTPGSDADIVRVCGLLAEACEEVLRWEERVRFARVPGEFVPVQNVLAGAAGRQLDGIGRLQPHLSGLLEGTPATGTHRFSLEFDLPEDWSENYEKALDAAIAEAFP